MMKFIELYDAPYGGWIQLYSELPTSRQMNRLALLRRTWESLRLYGAEGTWSVPVPTTQDLPTPGVLAHILAEFYNPMHTVEFEYEDQGTYDLTEIKQRITHYVSCDDDILTQFLDGKEIAARLSAAETFQGIVRLIEDMYGTAEST